MPRHTRLLELLIDTFFVIHFYQSSFQFVESNQLLLIIPKQLQKVNDIPTIKGKFLLQLSKYLPFFVKSCTSLQFIHDIFEFISNHILIAFVRIFCLVKVFWVNLFKIHMLKHVLDMNNIFDLFQGLVFNGFFKSLHSLFTIIKVNDVIFTRKLLFIVLIRFYF